MSGVGTHSWDLWGKQQKMAHPSLGVTLAQLRANLDTILQQAAANEPVDVATVESAVGNVDDLEKQLETHGLIGN